MSLKIGVSLPCIGGDAMEFALAAERLGVDSVWSAEHWAGDALTPLAYLAAKTTTVRLISGVVVLGARSPAMVAMSAMSLQSLSQGRFVLGLGTSGPQVVEGWHGARFERPLARTAETIEIVRLITSGRHLSYHGRVYELPLPGGEGRPIKSALEATPVPIWVAALGPANLKLTGALADGWIGNSFLPETADVFLEQLERLLELVEQVNAEKGPDASIEPPSGAD